MFGLYRTPHQVQILVLVPSYPSLFSSDAVQKTHPKNLVGPHGNGWSAAQETQSVHP